MQDSLHIMAVPPTHNQAIASDGNPEQQSTLFTSGDSQHLQSFLKDRIVLKVGERCFETFHTTLTGESDYFAAALSGRWGNTGGIDGNYFIDTDPDVFQHILGYLRTGTPPLFYNVAAKSFDYERYVALLGQARYFGIAKLEDWIVKERYLDAVTTKYTSILISGDDVLAELSDRFGAMRGNSALEIHPAWETKKVYVCSRGVPVYRGRPGSCGIQCHKAGPGEYEEERVLKVLAMRRDVVFDPQVCLEDEVEE